MMRVMVVDDDESILRTVELVLRTGGFEVVKASSGGECLEQLRRDFCGVILMDIMMPGLDGWSTIRRMVEEGLVGGRLVCMLTARELPGEEANGLQEYVFDYLAKPFDAPSLLAMVRNAATVLAA